MYLIKFCVICIIAIATQIEAMEDDHICDDIVTRVSDDGEEISVTEKVCCPGYFQNTDGSCIPMCKCINGFCPSPNVCECNKGYNMVHKTCQPICKDKCHNGYCMKPGICGCKPGYVTKNSTHCVPNCQPNCSDFSTCIAPNECKCNEGYEENKLTNKCRPICKDKCNNGFCRKPGICGCNEGYHLDDKNSTNCVPQCKPECPQFSTCIEPQKCQCLSGYKENSKTKQCVAECKDLPRNAKCIKPPNVWDCNENYRQDLKIDKCILKSCICIKDSGYCLDHENQCECHEGFMKNSTTHKCEPVCEPKCENSICVANNVCRCSDDYHATPKLNVCEENSMCNGRPCKNGDCLITGECKCKTGFIKFLSYHGHIQCDPVTIFVGKLMFLVLGVPLLLASGILIIVYIIARKRSYYIDEQPDRELQLLSAMD